MRWFSVTNPSLEAMPRAMNKRNLTGAPGTKEDGKQLARWWKQLS